MFDVAEMLEWVKTGEAALSGTAAVLAGVGTLVLRDGVEVRVGTGDVGVGHAAVARRPGRISRTASRADSFGWTRKRLSASSRPQPHRVGTPPKPKRLARRA